jgi:hypothetical protein
MEKGFNRKFIPPPGPLLGVILIGVLLLSALLYYRAVKIQRFLEPALAISQPRIKFSRNINNLLLKEFGKEESRRISFRAGSILVERSFPFEGTRNNERTEPEILKKLSNVFLSALNDPATRDNISLILVGIRFPVGPGMTSNKENRYQVRKRAESILDSIYAAEPRLEKEYGKYFAAVAVPVDAGVKENNWMEFRIIPSEMLHIEVLRRLEKYAY